jgi:hypothetical protein
MDISGKNTVEDSKKVVEKTFNSKMWNPITWSYFLQKSDYLQVFYESIPLHLTHALDINPGKFDIETSDDGIYLNKGKMQGLLFSIYNKNWNDF